MPENIRESSDLHVRERMERLRNDFEQLLAVPDDAGPVEPIALRSLIQMTPVFDNKRGPLPVSAAFRHTGGMLLITAAGSGCRDARGTVGMEININGAARNSCSIAWSDPARRAAKFFRWP